MEHDFFSSCDGKFPGMKELYLSVRVFSKILANCGH